MQATVILLVVVGFLLLRDIWRDRQQQKEREVWIEAFFLKHFGQIPLGRVVGQKRTPTREDITELAKLDRAPTAESAGSIPADDLILSTDEEQLLQEMVNRTGITPAQALRIIREQAAGNPNQEVTLDN